MELLVKDVLPELEQATDVPKRVQEVRMRQPTVSTGTVTYTNLDQQSSWQQMLSIQHAMMQQQQVQLMQQGLLGAGLGLGSLGYSINPFAR